MEPTTNPTPTMPTSNEKPNHHTKWHTTAIIMSIIAICGIGFGVYGMLQIIQKDQQISDLEAEIAAVPEPTPVSPVVSDLYTVGNISMKRKYYLGVTDLDQQKDAREKDVYIIDTTKLGSKDGVRKYDLANLLDETVSEKVASLPDTLEEGTVNAMPKADCQSFKVIVGDPASFNSSVDWTIRADWSNTLPLTVSLYCVYDDTELSLGTGLYSLSPDTNELTKIIDTIF